MGEIDREREGEEGICVWNAVDDGKKRHAQL
jgi:hypothetical protein